MVTAEKLKILLNDRDLRIKELKSELKQCRNELCLKCGRYHESYKGACSGCKWEWMED